MRTILLFQYVSNLDVSSVNKHIDTLFIVLCYFLCPSWSVIIIPKRKFVGHLITLTDSRKAYINNFRIGSTIAGTPYQ